MLSVEIDELCEQLAKKKNLKKETFEIRFKFLQAMAGSLNIWIV